MSIIYSHNTTWDSIYIDNSVVSGTAGELSNLWRSSKLKEMSLPRLTCVCKANTDGADSIRSSNLTFDDWTVYNGDDSISIKANSTDITIKNCKFYNGLGIAIGSIGQYKDAYETISGVTIENITYSKTLHAVRPYSSSSKHLWPQSPLTHSKSSTSKHGPAIKSTTRPTAAAAV